MAELLSVGIDIGTSTTQLVFSRIAMENTTGFFTVPRVAIVNKEIIYRSRVFLTPLCSPERIDSAAVREIVAREYRSAGFSPADVDTGAVIITGESARKENAAAVLAELSEFAGEFVVSTAGPDLESILAGKGSGACAYSAEHHCVSINLDIGGGTTNMVLFSDGEVVSKGCLDIGGRLIRLTEDRVVQYISPSAGRIAESLGISLAVGRPAGLELLTRITDKMADLLAQALGLKPQEPLLRQVQTPESAWLDVGGHSVQKVFFSGGVADCIDASIREDFPFGDIGVLLGRSIARGLLCQRLSAGKGTETIRATVAGAGMFTTVISGSTITCSPGCLPLQNLPVLKLSAREQAACFRGEQAALRERVAWFLRQSGAGEMLLALPGKPDPDYPELKALAGCLAGALQDLLPSGAPVLVAVECDMAKALGTLLGGLLRGRRDIVCIDSVRIEQGDYVDLGRPLLDGLVIPVVVKTLLFG